MSRVDLNQSKSKSGEQAASSSLKSGAVHLAIIASAMLFLPGCGMFQNRHHIEVGSIPDDYRTNHPISIAEQEEHLDVLVGASDRGISLAQRSVIEGFVAQYMANGSGPVQVMLPSHGTNAAAAKRVQSDVVAALRKGGVMSGHIITMSYAPPTSDGANPIRIAYRALAASTDKCGKWPEDLTQDTENKHYADFGCSYQNNLAAMIANPADLLGPRAVTQVDPAKRGNVIKKYQETPAPGRSEIDY
ncbi:MAG: CpaD family pilus assembly lipoprotein [Rhizobiaceae bacterium]